VSADLIRGVAREHPDFPAGSLDATIWRYIDFTKLVSILNSRSLFFARADQFDDPFEGSSTQANVEARADFLREAGMAPEIIPLALENEEALHQYELSWI
jgi:hypothetical protein